MQKREKKKTKFCIIFQGVHAETRVFLHFWFHVITDYI